VDFRTKFDPSDLFAVADMKAVEAKAQDKQLDPSNAAAAAVTDRPVEPAAALAPLVEPDAKTLVPSTAPGSLLKASAPPSELDYPLV
jgi:hypothetical protein